MTEDWLDIPPFLRRQTGEKKMIKRYDNVMDEVSDGTWIDYEDHCTECERIIRVTVLKTLEVTKGTMDREELDRITHEVMNYGQ